MNKNQDYHVSSLQNENAPLAVLILTGDNFNDLEFFYPYYRLNEAGYRVDVASPDGSAIKGKSGNEIRSTQPVRNISEFDYELLYIPGGKAPSALRKNEHVLQFVKKFAATNKPIAVICHGSQILVSADLVKGKRFAAWPEVESEIQEAKGTFVNTQLVEDGQFISARWPGDLPVHLKAVIKRLEGINRVSKNKSFAA